MSTEDYFTDQIIGILGRQESLPKEGGRVLEVAYFDNVRFVGHSKHYPQPLMYSVYTGRLTLPTVEQFMSLGRGTVYEELWNIICGCL